MRKARQSYRVHTDHARNLIRMKARQLARRPEFQRCDRRDIEQDLWVHVLSQEDRFDPARGSINAFVACVVASGVVVPLSTLPPRQPLLRYWTPAVGLPNHRLRCPCFPHAHSVPLTGSPAERLGHSYPLLQNGRLRREIGARIELMFPRAIFMTDPRSRYRFSASR